MNPMRGSQRRSPGIELSSGGPPQNVPPRSISPAVGVGTNRPVAPRASTSGRPMQPVGGSLNRTDGTRRTNSQGGSSIPLSQIEKSVTHLLVATKQLLETLTQWSRGNATDTQVSDVYVRLGYEFNMACRAFTAINVDTSDLGNVPELLRNILEATLSQEASVESLDKYLPRIRDIIINLLHGLKRKQTRLRQRNRDRENGQGDAGGSGDGPPVNQPPGRTMSTSTTGSVNSGLTTLLNEGIEDGYRPQSQRESDGRNSGLTGSPTRRILSQRDQSRGSVSEQSSLSSNTMQNIPVMPPYPGDETMPGGPSGGDLDNFPPPPPPPKQSQQSALAALQRGGDLERRASRRYSAYQISKLVGVQGVPMLPTQTTPIPNRGRGEMRESMRAVQTRDNVQHQRNKSSRSIPAPGSSPVRVPSRVTEEPEGARAELPASRPELPHQQSSEDKYRPSATLNGPPADIYPVPDLGREAGADEQEKPVKTLEKAAPIARAPTPDKQPNSFMMENSPPATKELTLFLQYKSKVKKFVLPEGYDELSIGRLQLAFIEKFSWNTQQNGSDLPDIYIQDPVSGVRHELEDLSDIKDRTVLVLNVEALDEVKKHIDEGIGSLKKIVEEVRQNMDDQGAALRRVSDRQQETAKDVARLAAAPPAVIPQTVGSPKAAGAVPGARKLSTNQLSEIQSLRRDLAVLRQTYSNFQSEVQGSMSALRAKANSVKMTAAKVAVPDIEGDTGKAYVSNGRKQLNTDSDRLVNKVDDLQDLVEDLRKDVVHRGVRPLPRQLEAVTKDITQLTKELNKMEEYMKQEKPVWTKIWEKELEDVCQGRDELRVMEDLIVDLRDDLEKASETFALVEQATKEQMKDAAGANGVGGGGPGGQNVITATRQFSKGLSSIRENAFVDPRDAKEGVLGEVRALQPNHENRLEAIERAEKLRQKELETRMQNPLKKELANFVEEGKLKKSGGVEEVERARKAKEERIRREVWERQNGIIPEDPIGEEETSLSPSILTPVFEQDEGKENVNGQGAIAVEGN
ncbi:actin interacting protein 3-domain-containing protein [Cladorrhinum samala]|uniref:Actin interacting protein 3-domain-containing protein n=1 Tax=Cladorrhinum samala TaxID=585594 RepID=A0AAV9H843_9PEZI|nr:actin interacting protein 3-domain-containing protein [Cladorrhinum samala]